MTTVRYVRCAQCGRVDRTRTVFSNDDRPAIATGTRTTMQCTDCGLPQVTNGRATQFAQRCRACCPTGHRTHPENERSTT